MALRTNATDVKAILDNSQLEDSEVTVFINTANTIMAEVYSTTTLSDDTLEEIEKWLSAHLVSITKERTASDEKVGEASIKYTGKFSEGLRSTTYGQMVLVLDTTGAIGNLGKKQARLKAIESFDD